MKFTKPSVEALKRRAERYEVWEDGRTGLGIRISPSGRKTWVLMYRFEGKARRMTLGAYPKVSIASAHTKAGNAHEALEHGRDPGAANVAQRRAQRQAETVSDLAREYLERTSKRSLDQDRYLLDREILPTLSKTKVRDVRRRDAIRLLDGLTDRNVPILGNRVATLLTALFNFAVDRDIIEASPLARLPHAPASSRQRVLSDAEIASFWNALPTIKAAPVTRLGLKLALLTGQRRTEIAEALRSEFDLDAKTWTIPGSRRKAHRIGRTTPDHVLPLSDQAVAVIRDADELRERERKAHGLDEPSPYAFASPLRRGGSIQPSALTHAVIFCRAELGLDKGETAPVFHDIRRSVATGLASLGVSPLIVSRILSHAATTITGRVYDRHSYTSEMSSALQSWADHIEALAVGRKIAANVTTLRPEAVKTA